jgi:transcriptional regulator with XRE-family HTH domain
MDIGKKLRRLRLQRGLTQSELADRCELSKGFISQLERNLTTTTVATLLDILETLGSDAASFFSEAPEEEQLAFGEDDIFVTGRNYLKPGQGNPFLFDNVEDEEVLENRKKSKGKGRIFVIIGIILGILVGAGAGVAVSKMMLSGMTQEVAAEQTFRCEDLSITLTEEFVPMEAEGYTACYSAGETAVLVLREDFTAREGFGELDLQGYGALVLENNGFADSVMLGEKDGLTTFGRAVADPVSGENFYYYCGLYKSQDAFWMVQVTTVAEGAAERIPQFRRWLGSVSLAG